MGRAVDAASENKSVSVKQPADENRKLRAWHSDASTASGAESSVAAATSEAGHSMVNSLYVEPLVGKWWFPTKNGEDSFSVERDADGQLIWTWDGAGLTRRRLTARSPGVWHSDDSWGVQLKLVNDVLQGSWFVPGARVPRVRCTAQRSSLGKALGEWSDVDGEQEHITVLDGTVFMCGSRGVLQQEGYNCWTAALRGGRLHQHSVTMEADGEFLDCSLLSILTGKLVSWSALRAVSAASSPPAKRARLC